jgi:hypothetical protein
VALAVAVGAGISADLSCAAGCVGVALDTSDIFAALGGGAFHTVALGAVAAGVGAFGIGGIAGVTVAVSAGRSPRNGPFGAGASLRAFVTGAFASTVDDDGSASLACFAASAIIRSVASGLRLWPALWLRLLSAGALIDAVEAS